MSIPVERFDEFDESPDELPPPWIFFGGTDKNPVDGPKVVGEYVRLELGVPTRFSETSVVVIQLKDGSERSLWLLWHVLRNQFKRAKPKPGELIKVSYLGEKISATGNDYHDFKVRASRDQGETNWDDITQDGDDDDEDGNVSW